LPVQHPALRFAAYPLARSYTRIGTEPLSADTAAFLPQIRGGVTGQAIIKAILGGQRDPHKLAEFRNPRADFAAIEEILTRMGKSATSGKPLQDGARNQSSRSPKSIHALIFAKRAPVSKLPT